VNVHPLQTKGSCTYSGEKLYHESDIWANDMDLVKNEDSITMHATYKTVVSINTELEFNER
jgi:hypothetical protein